MRLIKTFSLIAVIASLFDCSHSTTRLFNNPGKLVIRNDHESIIVGDEQQFLVEWESQGRKMISSMRDVQCEEESTSDKWVTVTVIESNDSLIRIGSSAWKSWADLPAAYLDPEMEVDVKGSEWPTLLIPLHQIVSISIYERKYTRKDFFASPKLMLVGAAAGALSSAATLISIAENEFELTTSSTVSSGDIILTSGVGALIGAVAFPIYTYFKITSKVGIGEDIGEFSSRYPVKGISASHEIAIIQTGD